MAAGGGLVERGTTYTRLQCWTASGAQARVLAAVEQDDALHTLLVDGRAATPAVRAKKRVVNPGPRWAN